MLSSRGAWLLFALCLCVRLVGWAALDHPGRGAETAHHEHRSIAGNLARGYGFRYNFYGDPTAPDLTSQQAPWVPSVLALCYLTWGVESRAAFVAMQWLQCLVGSATCVVLASYAASAVPRAGATHPTLVAWAVGIAAALYPPLIVSCLHIQALVWNLAWLALLLWSERPSGDTHHSINGFVFVIAATCGLLTDPILAAVIASLLLLQIRDNWSRFAALSRGRRLVGSARRPALLAAGIALGIAPWMARNLMVHGRLVFVKDSLAYVFWQGNNLHSQGTDKLLVAEANVAALRSSGWPPWQADQMALHIRGQAVSVDSCLSAQFRAELYTLPNEMARMDRFAEMAWRIPWEQPGLYLRQCARRLGYWLWFDRTNPRSFLWHYRLGYIVLLLLAAPGFWLCRPIHPWLPVATAMLALTVVHVMIITSARFRIPMEMLLLFPAGMSLAYGYQMTRANVCGLPRPFSMDPGHS